MKIQAEKHFRNSEAAAPDFTGQVRSILDASLAIGIEKKIDYNQYAIDESNSKLTASVNVMNDAELNAAKSLLNEVIASYPKSESLIRRVLTIIDPIY